MSPAVQHLLKDDLVAPKERALILQFNKLCSLSFPQGIHPVIWPSLSGIHQSTPLAFQEFQYQRGLCNYDIFSTMISNTPTDAQTQRGCVSMDIYRGFIKVCLHCTCTEIRPPIGGGQLHSLHQRQQQWGWTRMRFWLRNHIQTEKGNILISDQFRATLSHWRKQSVITVLLHAYDPNSDKL